MPPRVVLIVGQPGSGNEVFARQIAYTRAKQTGITYFTVRTDPEVVREDMSSYGWDIKPLEASGNWKFKNLPEKSLLVDAVIDEMKQQRTVVVDSLSELLLTNKTHEIAELLTAMSSQNRENQEYHLLLLTEGMQDQLAETTMQHFAEGVINFTINWTADATARHLIIRKMRGTQIPTRRLPYSIGKKGFVIETATRI